MWLHTFICSQLPTQDVWAFWKEFLLYCIVLYWPADVSVCSENHAAILGLRPQQKESQEVSRFNCVYLKPEAEIIFS